MKLFLFNVFMSMIHKPRFLSSDDACNVTLKREITCIHFYIMNLSVNSIPIRAGAARDVYYLAYRAETLPSVMSPK